MSTPDERQKAWIVWLEERVDATWENLQTNHLWQRMFKNTIVTTCAVIFAIIPGVVDVYGKAAYLAPITTVFGHPGRRFGMMAEALILALSGSLIGVAWSMFGLYLSSLVYDQNPPAAYTIRGIFLVIVLMIHGFLRARSPRLFIFVLLMLIVSVVSLTSVATAVSKLAVTQLLYPILTAIALLLLVNISIFPEFSSGYLGITTIETLGQTVGALRDAGTYFTNIAEGIEKQEKSGAEEEMTKKNSSPTLAEKPTQKSKSKSFFKTKFFNTLHASSGTTEDKSKEAEVPKTVKLKSLTDQKKKLRSSLANCKAAQQECNYELAWAVLPPRDMKQISVVSMKGLVANTISLIGACESKYALMGDKDDEKSEDATPPDESRPITAAGPQDSHENSADEKEASEEESKKHKRKKSKRKDRNPLQAELDDLELIKPIREIEFGDAELLKYLVSRISKPLADLQEKIDRSVDVVAACLAFCYDVPKLPSGALAPSGIELEEIDIRITTLAEAMVHFDRNSATALEKAATLRAIDQPQVDIMPRMETFLISSFLLNLRQAAIHTLEMLKHCRIILKERNGRHGRRRLYPPRINWAKWLASGGESDMLALPESGRKDARTGKKKQDLEGESNSSKEHILRKGDLEAGVEATQPNQRPKKLSSEKQKHSKQRSFTQRLRHRSADLIESIAGSEDIIYAFKLTIAVILVVWPALIQQWNRWYSLNRGLWAALQLVTITEVALGTSITTFVLRAFGTIIGCIWGYAAYEAGNGDRIVAVVMIVIGIIPSTYVQLGTKYVKAGMVSIISMAVVLLATEDHTVPGTATENFVKRMLAFLIGGIVALIIEVVLFPVRARDRLVESLAASVRQINQMEGCLAYGIEAQTNLGVQPQALTNRFERARGKAEDALAAAETFLPFCDTEPRLKGSFEGMALIYAEILYVLHAIVDRMDNMLHLRQEYGSGVLEELNAQVYSYRRNLAGSITIDLFAVHEALTTKLPLPQFLPSARLAHLRMINRVRQVMTDVVPNETHDLTRSQIEVSMVKRIVLQKFVSWNAVSAGQIEVIEYLEELIELTKLLVGANEFRSGMFTRETYREYVERIQEGQESALAVGANEQWREKKDETEETEGGKAEVEDKVPAELSTEKHKDLTRRRRTFSMKESGDRRPTLGHNPEDENDIPMVLQRVRSRRVEEIHNNKLVQKRSRSRSTDNRGKGVEKEA